MAEEEYEILPHQLLSDLKTEVEALKKKLTQPDAKANELILEIESLKDSVHELNVVFEKAMEEMKEILNFVNFVEQNLLQRVSGLFIVPVNALE